MQDIDHPTPKQPAVTEWLVDRASKIGGTILDPFMGSGTTGVAAVRLGRGFIGIETDAKYFDVARRRIQAAINAPDLFVEAPKPARQEAFEWPPETEVGWSSEIQEWQDT